MLPPAMRASRLAGRRTGSKVVALLSPLRLMITRCPERLYCSPKERSRTGEQGPRAGVTNRGQRKAGLNAKDAARQTRTSVSNLTAAPLPASRLPASLSASLPAAGQRHHAPAQRTCPPG